MLAHFFVGGSSVVTRRFDPGVVLGTIEKEKITTWNSVPIMVLRLLEHPDIDRYDLSSLRCLSYGAAPMPLEVLKKAVKVFGPILYQVYGLTETYLLATLSNKDHVDDETDPPSQTSGFLWKGAGQYPSEGCQRGWRGSLSRGDRRDHRPGREHYERALEDA